MFFEFATAYYGYRYWGIGIFIETKNKIDELYEKISSGAISEVELQQMDGSVQEQLNYLENYFGKQEIEAYRGYFNMKKGNVNSPLLKFAMGMVDFTKGEMTFSDLLQIKDLKSKGKYTLSFTHYEDIDLNLKEQKEIKKFATDKLLTKLVVFIFLLGFVIKTYDFYTNDQMHFLFPVLLSIVTLINAYSIVRYIILLISKKSIVKGAIGFITDIESTSKGSGRNNVSYIIYFPKYNERESVVSQNISNSIKKVNINKLIKAKTMVIYVKLSGFTFVIPLNSERYY